jgi:hypothetical protein
MLQVNTNATSNDTTKLNIFPANTFAEFGVFIFGGGLFMNAPITRKAVKANTEQSMGLYTILAEGYFCYSGNAISIFVIFVDFC